MLVFVVGVVVCVDGSLFFDGDVDGMLVGSLMMGLVVGDVMGFVMEGSMGG